MFETMYRPPRPANDAERGGSSGVSAGNGAALKGADDSGAHPANDAGRSFPTPSAPLDFMPFGGRYAPRLRLLMVVSEIAYQLPRTTAPPAPIDIDDT